MKRGVRGLIVAAMAAAGVAMPAIAQESATSFLKAVKDRDGTKVTDALNTPGSTVILVRDDSGDDALHIVTKRRDLTWLQFLLAKGAPVDTRDRQGNSALIDAAQTGFPEGVQQLLAAGAQVDLANNRGETALIVATQARDLASVRELVQYGADVHATDHVAGMSALDYAQRDGRSPVILKLLQEAKPVAKKQVSGPTLN